MKLGRPPDPRRRGARPPRLPRAGPAAHPDAADRPSGRTGVPLAEVAGVAVRGAPPEPRSGEHPARVLVVDDRRAVAEAMAMAIDSQPDLRCVGTAGTLAEAERIIEERTPDIVLADVKLPDGDGIEEAARLHATRPEIRVVLLTARSDVTVLARAASAGVCGFLPRESGFAELIRALRTARDGWVIVDRATLSRVLERVQRQPVVARNGADPLTQRELEVLRAMGTGLDPQRIAMQLGMSVHTCRGHVKNILAKLGAHSQLEAVVTAMRRGVLAEISVV